MSARIIETHAFARIKGALNLLGKVAEEAEIGEMDNFAVNNDDAIRVIEAFRAVRDDLPKLEAEFGKEVLSEIEDRQAHIAALQAAMAAIASR